MTPQAPVLPLAGVWCFRKRSKSNDRQPCSFDVSTEVLIAFIRAEQGALSVLVFLFSHLDFREHRASCQLSGRPRISIPPLLAHGFFLCLLLELRIAVCASATVSCSVFTWCQSSNEEKTNPNFYEYVNNFCSMWRAIFKTTEICCTSSVAVWTANSVCLIFLKVCSPLEDGLVCSSCWKTELLWLSWLLL